MDYIKVKTSHVFYSKHLTDKEFRAWITSMCVAAHLEDVPTTKELSTYIHPATLKKYIDKQSTMRRSYSEVIAKVLEDVSCVKVKREKSKATSQQYRDSHKDRDTSRDNPRDKTIEEKSILKEIRNIYIEGCTNKSAVKNGVDLDGSLTDSQKEEIIKEINFIATSDFNKDLISSLIQCDLIIEKHRVEQNKPKKGLDDDDYRDIIKNYDPNEGCSIDNIFKNEQDNLSLPDEQG